MDHEPSSEITEILARVEQGDESAAAVLLPRVYRELRALAGAYFKCERPEHTLQPTALVHEAFLRLAAVESAGWESRAHFFAIAARAMRRILNSHARKKKAAKRGGGRERVTLTGIVTPVHQEVEVELIALDEAMTKLARLFPRQGRIMELRFFAGLNETEVAHLLGITTRTVQREWRLARAFLRHVLKHEIES